MKHACDERQSVFVLNATRPEEHPEIVGKYDQDPETGEIRAVSVQLGIFDSVEKAEENIRFALKIQADRRKAHPEWGSSDYVSFELTELYLNGGIDAEGNHPCFESRRTYDGNGELHCVSDLDDRCTKRFVGRDEPLKGVNEGDFCWYVVDESIFPILYQKAPMTSDEVREHFDDDIEADYTDDTGLAFSVDLGHLHPSPLYVYPLSALPLAELSDETKDMMREVRDRYYKGEAL